MCTARAAGRTGARLRRQARNARRAIGNFAGRTVRVSPTDSAHLPNGRPVRPARRSTASRRLLTQRDGRGGRHSERCVPRDPPWPGRGPTRARAPAAGSEPGQGMTRQAVAVDKGRKNGFRESDKGWSLSRPEPGQGVIRRVRTGIGKPFRITDDYGTSSVGRHREVSVPRNRIRSVDRPVRSAARAKDRPPACRCAACAHQLGRPVRACLGRVRAARMPQAHVGERRTRRHPRVAHRGRRPELQCALRARARVLTGRQVIVRPPRREVPSPGAAHTPVGSAAPTGHRPPRASRRTAPRLADVPARWRRPAHAVAPGTACRADHRVRDPAD